MKAGNELTGHSGNDEIGTPQGLFDWLNRRFLFSFDAAASHENHKLPFYATIDGLFYDLSGGVRTEASDGLTASWNDLRVFVNPPYSQPLMGQFIQKAIDERNSAQIIVLLVKFDPSTKNGRLLMDNFHLEYLPRVKYDGMKHAATFPSVVAIAKPDWKQR